MNLANIGKVFLVLCIIDVIGSAFNFIEIEKAKDLKKTISTKTNLLVLYASSPKNAEVINVKNVLKSVEGSFAFVDCTNKDLKKLCKKSLPEGNSYVLKHYKDGAFNKDYDRQMTKNSLQNFMRDPTGEFPYEEDPTARDVVHLLDTSVSKFPKKIRSNEKHQEDVTVNILYNCTTKTSFLFCTVFVVLFVLNIKLSTVSYKCFLFTATW